ncbi:HipA N-terminal domain-containing protein, partial [Marinobacter sp.]
MSRALDVYLRGDKAGLLEQDEAGQLSFAYDSEYLAQNKVAISVSMPLREEAFSDAVARPF